MFSFTEFCNYLRGVKDSSINENNSSGSINDNIKLFFKFFSDFAKLFKLLFPNVVSISTFVFLVLLVDLIALEFVVYQVGLLSGKFFKVLTSKDLSGFGTLAIYAIALIIINSSMKSFNDFLARLLQIVWRKQITLKLHELYFTKKNFYYVQNDVLLSNHNQNSLINSAYSQDSRNLTNSDLNDLVFSNIQSNTSNRASSVLRNNRINVIKETKTRKKVDLLLDNVDQRITQDVNSFCESISNIVCLFLISPFVIGWYGYQTYNNVGYTGPLAILIYFIVWGMINGPLTAPIARVVYKQDKKEGDFRYKHMNIRVNGESIAFYDSSKCELDEMNKTFNGLLNVSFKRNWKEFILNVFINMSQYMGGIIAYLILAIPILSNAFPDYDPTQIGQLINNYSFKCQYLIYLFTRLYNILNQMPTISGNLQRIKELIDKMSNNIRLDNTKTQLISQNLNENYCFEIKSLTIMLPKLDRKVLIKDLNFKFEKNKNILVTGRSGCGKTSIFRCINGLWNSYTGQIIKNKQFMDSLFFLPQNSYFTSGSLMDQITYPILDLEIDINDPNMTRKLVEINEWFKILNLEHLLERVDNDLTYKPEFNWQSILSNGEQQRLSFIRILFHKPKFALLDEFTSSVDQDTESLMYDYLKRIDCTFISIAHRDTVRKYHDYELKILIDSSWTLTPLEIRS